MSKNVSWMLELSVKPGQAEALKGLMNEMITATQTNEPETLSYEWSLSDDGQILHLFERYADSDAVMTHLATFGEKFAGRFLEALQLARFVVYGAPSQEVKEALAAFNPTYMASVGGFSR